MVYGLIGVCAAILACAAFGCRPDSASNTETLVVLAAASVSDVIDELASGFERETGCRVSVSAGASGALRTQIELGAPCDVFLSADARQIDALVGKGLVQPDARRVVAGNRLVVALRSGLDVPGTWPDALRSKSIQRIAVANPDYAPAGRYARASLEGVGLWAQVQPKLVFADNASAAALHVSLGTVDAAIIYATNAASLGAVQVVYTFPPGSHEPIRYVGGVVSDERSSSSELAPRRALEFLTYLTEPGSAAVWRKHGFTAPVPGGTIP